MVESSITGSYSGKVGGGGNGGSAGDRGKMALQWMVASDGARRLGQLAMPHQFFLGEHINFFYNPY